MPEYGTEAANLDSPRRAGKYLTFILGNEEYGVQILSVREIIGMVPINTLPNLPHYIKGVINLRGRVIPITDLRLKFGLPPRDYDKETCIIVANFGEMLVGIVVDTVSEVIDIRENEIEDSPSFGSGIETGFILGMGKVKGGVKILLNIKQVLLSSDLIKLGEFTTKADGKMEKSDVQ